MNKKRIWKIGLIVSVIAMAFPVAPEIGILIVLVDIIGFDLLLLLFELQLALLTGTFYQHRIKPVLVWANWVMARLDPYYFIPSKKAIRAHFPVVVHAVPFLVGATILTASRAVYV